jgi:hypothetical protein
VSTPVLYAQVHPAGYKDPTTSLLISVVVPGGGHLYSGETKKGAIILGTAIGGPIIGATIAVGSASNGSTSGIGAGLLLGYGAALGAWVYGMVDSGNAARRHNSSVGLQTTVVPVIRELSNGKTAIGMALTY